MEREATQEEMAVMQQMAGRAGEDGKNLHAVFSMEAMELSEATKLERHKEDPVKYPESILGRPFYEEQEFVTIYIPGDKDNVPFRPVRAIDKVRWAEQYRQFKAGLVQEASGTPLSSLPFMSKAQVLELRYFGVKSAEQLLAMSDVNGQKIIGFAQLKQKVQDFLAKSADAGATAKLRKEIESRDARLSKTESENATLRTMVEEMSKKLDSIAQAKKG